MQEEREDRRPRPRSDEAHLRREKNHVQMKLGVASLLSVLAWAVFILLYALFWSTAFTLFQNIIVTIVSLFIAGLMIGLVWVIWGPREQWRTR